MRRRTLALLIAIAVMSVGAPLAAAAPLRVTTVTVTPKPQRTVGFYGFATYTFSAARGRRIVAASARIAGGTAGAVRITHRAISRQRTRYTVQVVFPGEQGTPGRLVVRLSTAA